MRKALVVIGFVMAMVGLAGATHPGSTSFYTLVGFTADSKSVYFQKITASVMEEEHWLAVWDATTGKQTTSQPTIRNCEPTGEKWNPTAKCDGDRPQIDKKTGERTVATLHTKHGKPVAQTVIGQKPKTVDMPDQVVGPGYTQEFEDKTVVVKTVVTFEGKKLPDPMAEKTPTAFFALELTLTAGKDTWTVKSRVHADPVENEDNGNLLEWRGLKVSHLAVAPDRHAVALVFGGKPFVIQRPKKL